MLELQLDVRFTDGKHDVVTGPVQWIEDYLTALAESGRAALISGHEFTAA